MLIEKSHLFRREQIENSTKSFLELFEEYNYLKDVKNVSKKSV